MTILIHNLLLNAQASFLHRPADTLPLAVPAIPSNDVWFFSQIMPAENAIETTYSIIIESITGAPTTAILAAKFQSVSQTTQGGNSNGFTDSRPGIFDLSDTSLLPDGDWPADLFNMTPGSFVALTTQVAAQPISGNQFRNEITSTGGKKTTRRIRGGVDHRLALKLTTTGGTANWMGLTIEQNIRYE